MVHLHVEAWTCACWNLSVVIFATLHVENERARVVDHDKGLLDHTSPSGGFSVSLGFFKHYFDALSDWIDRSKKITTGTICGAQVLGVQTDVILEILAWDFHECTRESSCERSLCVDKMLERLYIYLYIYDY